MRKAIKLLNRLPDIKGRVWVDAYSLVALIRFTFGYHVDVATLSVILGAYVLHNIGTQNNDTKSIS